MNFEFSTSSNSGFMNSVAQQMQQQALVQMPVIEYINKSKYSVDNDELPELDDADILFQERELQAALVAPVQAEEFIQLSQNIPINNIDTELNNEFISTENGIKTFSTYKNIIRKASENNISLDFDKANINLIIFSENVENPLVLNYIQNIIAFFSKLNRRNVGEITPSARRLRNIKISNFIAENRHINTLSDETYKTIKRYARSNNITIDDLTTNRKQQGGQYGGMWQRGGFFMTCS